MGSIRNESADFPAPRRPLTLEPLEPRLLLSGLTMYVDDGFTSATPGWGVDHFATIQNGINAAGAGDTVMVAAGVYNENISLGSSRDGLMLLGAGAAVTIIDGGGSGSVVEMDNFDGGTISGFTIRNGSAGIGGGINCDSSDSTITSCIITDNSADLNGGGIYIGGGSPALVNNVLTYNTAYFGAASYVENASPTYANNTIYGNTAESCGGALYSPGSTFTMYNCILWNNQSNPLFPNDEIMLRSDSFLTIRYSIIMDGTDEIFAWMGADYSYNSTNSESNPRFVAAGSGDFHLQSISPAIDAAYGNAAPATDFDGNPRVDDPLTTNTGAGTPVYADIGAFEYGSLVSNDPPTIDSLTASPSPVTRPDSVTLTAVGVDDPDGAGTVAVVGFYRDANANGTLEPGTDVLLGTDTDGTDGWSWTGSTAGWPVGSTTYFARARDNYSAYSDPVSTSGNVLNAAPTISLDEPTGTATRTLGYTVSWTDSDPDDDASIDLFWDLDTNPANNDVASEGTAWGVIATGLSEDAADSYAWGVNTPEAVSEVYLLGTIDDGTASAADYTATTLEIVAPPPAPGYIGTISGPGTAKVHVYDMVGILDVSLSDINVVFTDGDTIDHIDLNGTNPMDGLGLVITGADTAGTINDYRTTAGDVAFLASSGQFAGIYLNGSVTGWNLNGLTLQDMIFAGDIDGDGQTGDLTAVYVGDYVQGNIKVQGSMTGDIWIAGANAYNWSLKVFHVLGGAFAGDLRIPGKVGVVKTYGDYTHVMDVGPELRYFLLYGGNMSGQVSTTGPMYAFLVDGNILGSAELNVGGVVQSGDSSQSWGVPGESIHYLILRTGIFGAGANVYATGRIFRTNLPNHETDNGGEEFGIYAGSFSAIVLGSTTYGQSSLPFADGDFVVAVA